MDVLDIGYLRKLINSIASGFKSQSTTQQADGSYKVIITWNDNTTSEFIFNQYKGEKGDQGFSIVDVKIKQVTVGTDEEIHLFCILDDGTEIDAGTLPNEQYDDTQIKKDITDLKADKQDKTDNTLNTTNKTVAGAVNEVNGNLLDNVTFSADYKNIILNRKNGLNPYSIPISSIIHNAKLTELNDIDSTDIGNGKTLIYDSVTQKHKYVDSTGTDELVKMDSTTDAKYLTDLIDKQTVVNENGTLKVKKLDGQEVTIAEINYLKGLTMNVMDLVNAFANGGVKVWGTPVNTYADLSTLDRSTFIDGISYIVYVLSDETHSNAKTTYLCDKTSSTFFGNADSQRNFVTNPIDLANEVTGKLSTSHIDVDSLWSLLTINDTYKTLTAKNEVFGTHGAKAMYDELVTAIGDKANVSDFTKHTGDTDIHITTDERTKWNEVDNKVNKADITTTIDSTSTESQVPSASAVYNNAIKNKNIKTYTSLQQLGIMPGSETLKDIAKSMPDLSMALIPITGDVNQSLYPAKYGNLVAYRGNDNRVEFMFYPTTDYISNAKGLVFVCSYHGDRDWLFEWHKICTTSVADVSKSLSLNNTTAFTEGTITYNVTNGICDLTLAGLTNSICSAYKLSTTSFPTPKNKLVTVPIVNDVNGETVGMFYIDSNYNSIPTCHIYKTGCRGFCSVSYTVAES